MTKALLTLEESYDRGCNAGVEPHIANEDHLSENVTSRPRGLSGHSDRALGVDRGANCVLDLVSSCDKDDYGSLVTFLRASGLCTSGGECILGPDVLQVLGVGIVDGGLGTVEFDLLMNSSSLKVGVRGNLRVLASCGDVREGSCEHVRAGSVRLRVQGRGTTHTHDLIEAI